MIVHTEEMECWQQLLQMSMSVYEPAAVDVNDCNIIVNCASLCITDHICCDYWLIKLHLDSVIML